MARNHLKSDRITQSNCSLLTLIIYFLSFRNIFKKNL